MTHATFFTEFLPLTMQATEAAKYNSANTEL